MKLTSIQEDVDYLLELGVGDQERLKHIKATLEKGKMIYVSDRKYVESLIEKHLKSNEEKKLSKNSTSVEDLAISEKYRKELTMVQNLLDSEVGNPERLKSIKNMILNHNRLSEDDYSYLVQKHEQLEKIERLENKDLETLDIINKLQNEEIGNHQRLESIKKAINQNQVISSEDLAYLQDKQKQYKKIKSNNEEKSTGINPNQRRYRTEFKSEGTTLVLSIVLGILGLNGTGHMYVGKVGRGVAILIGSIILFALGIVSISFGVGIVLLIIYFIIFIWQIIDARNLCLYYNGYVESSKKPPW